MTSYSHNSNDENYDDEIYTQLIVEQGDPAIFKVFWLVPEESYIVQVDFETVDGIEWEEHVSFPDLSASHEYQLELLF